MDDISDELKGSGGAKGDQKIIDSKPFKAIKDSSIKNLPSATKLGQPTPTAMRRSVV